MFELNSFIGYVSKNRWLLLLVIFPAMLLMFSRPNSASNLRAQFETTPTTPPFPSEANNLEGLCFVTAMTGPNPNKTDQTDHFREVL